MMKLVRKLHRTPLSNLYRRHHHCRLLEVLCKNEIRIYNVCEQCVLGKILTRNRALCPKSYQQIYEIFNRNGKCPQKQKVCLFHKAGKALISRKMVEMIFVSSLGGRL
jgi:hypothetical protein